MEIVKNKHKIHLQQFQTHYIYFILTQTMMTNFLRNIQIKILNKVLIKQPLNLTHLIRTPHQIFLKIHYILVPFYQLQPDLNLAIQNHPHLSNQLRCQSI